MFRTTIASVAIFFGLLSLGATVAVASGTSTGTSDPICTTGACVFTPATETTTTIPGGSTTVPADTTTTTDSSSTSETHISRTETKKLIKRYERKTKTIIAVFMRPAGVKSAKGCIDPVRKGWIKVGGQFRNTRSNGGPFWDRWEKGWKVCNPVRVKVSGKYYMKGTKLNCGNGGILIPLGSAKKVRHRVRKSIEVPTYTAAIKIVQRSTTTTKTVGKTHVDYTCPTGTLMGTQCVVTTPGGSTKTYSCPKGELVMKDGKYYCKVCPQPTCTCPPGSKIGSDGKCHKDGTTTPPPPVDAPGPNPQPSPDDPVATPDNPTGSWQCYSETTGLPVQPRSDGTCPAGSYGA